MFTSQFLVLLPSVFISICGSLIWPPIISQCAWLRFIPVVHYIWLLFASIAHRNINGHCYDFMPHTWGISVWLLLTHLFPVPYQWIQHFPNCPQLSWPIFHCISSCLVKLAVVWLGTIKETVCVYMAVICAGLDHSATDVDNANDICVWLT